ncbi:CheR family methyltransferase [Schlesneria paludicola]|uniref:CheR family methyltransferase n=1 Tax=Schlesneria paludicola TaxID=360056 RepID=UPI00029B4809|nr:protein-glutamate O-methyltransferase CheR [Schlesneria paludicola]
MDASQLTAQEFEQFQALIFQLCGIRVPENKVTLLSNRIRRRLKGTGAVDFQAYLKLLRSPAGRDEREEFLNVVTTNETSFFRTEKHFEWLGTTFVDELRERARLGTHPQSIRIWSAACSSGEEPYTIAMCLAENRHKLTDWKIEIHGTDISETVLAKARAGLFGPDVATEVPEKLRARYFHHEAGSSCWEAKSSLKQLVTVSNHNLMEPNPQKAYDCIFIRNVLIYFSRESKQIVINHLVHSLAPGGYLVVGPSEGIFDMLGMLQKRSTFLYQKA